MSRSRRVTRKGSYQKHRELGIDPSTEKATDNTQKPTDTSGYIPKRIESRATKGYLYNHIHSSNAQKVKAAQVFIDGGVEKQNVLYMYI